jgi:uncharacterized membrane protein
MLSIFKKKDFFSPAERARIIDAIRVAEMQTSGEIRLFVESRCRYVEPLDRATEIFWGLKMDHTVERNGVLIYVAIRDHQLAILGDEGIHQKVGSEFWKKEVDNMLKHFQNKEYVEGIMAIVEDIGVALRTNFPYVSSTDKNELPDDIVFGK